MRFVNWTATEDIAQVQRDLARDAVDQARAMLLDAAERTAPGLRAQGVSNRGHVRSISRDLRHRDAWIVVTRETSQRRDGAYDGVGSQWHLTVATVRRLPGGRWAISSWSPQT